MSFRIISLGFIAAVALTAVSVPAFAASKSKTDDAIAATTSEAFAAQAAEVRKDMDAGGRYGNISSANRQKVDAQLDFIASLLQRKGSVDALNDQEKVQLLNAQEQANSILVGYDDQQLVCEYRRIAGSNRKEKVCQTKREIAAARDASRDAYRRQTSSFQNQEGMNNPGAR